MDLYRALNFRNLIYLINPDLIKKWDDAEQRASENWWFSARREALKKEMINYVIQSGAKAFVDESLYFTSLKGGRWNLPKSHGVLYCSENPLLSCLEVIYHDLMEGLPHLRRMKNIEDKIRTSINVRVPDELRFLIVVLVLELPNDLKETEIDQDLKSIKSICNRAGFANYTGHMGFDKEFLFGNEYIVTQTIGAVLYGRHAQLLRVQSARTLEEIKLVLPIDRALKRDPYPITLKPMYYEFDCRVEPLSPTSCFQFSIKAEGQNEVLDVQLHLDRVPTRPTIRSSCSKVYLPSNTRSPEKDGRMVVLQKYHLPAQCPHNTT